MCLVSIQIVGRNKPADQLMNCEFHLELNLLVKMD